MTLNERNFKQVCRSGQTGRTQDPLAYAYLGSNPSTCIMNLFSIVNIRLKENNDFIKTLKNINQINDCSFKQHEKIQETFSNYIKRDKKIIEWIKKETELGNKLQKKIFEHLIGQTYLIKEYAKYKLKYGLPHN